jgi:hypothetical protein
MDQSLTAECDRMVENCNDLIDRYFATVGREVREKGICLRTLNAMDAHLDDIHRCTDAAAAMIEQARSCTAESACKENRQSLVTKLELLQQLIRDPTIAESER